MANTVNGVAAISTNAQRRTAGAGADWFRDVLGGSGQILRADLAIDTTGDFDVDNPTVAITPSDPRITGANHRIYVVGIQVLASAATTLTFKSAANTLVTYNFAANGGMSVPVNATSFMLATNSGEKLVINFSAATPAIAMTLYYVIANEFKPLVGR